MLPIYQCVNECLRFRVSLYAGAFCSGFLELSSGVSPRVWVYSEGFSARAITDVLHILDI